MISRANHRAIVCAVVALALSPSAPADPKDGQKFKDWSARCQPSEDGARPICHVFQTIVVPESKQRVLRMSVGYAPGQPQLVALLSMPLGISLPPGVAIRVDDGEPLRVPVERCVSRSCQAFLPLDAEVLSTFKAGRGAQVVFFDAARQPVRVPVSLLGFTAAVSSLDRPGE